MFRRALAAGTVAVAMSCSVTGVAAQQGASGDFVLQAMSHTKDWPANEKVSPWDGKSDGIFTYRAIPCTGNAPMNNISSNLPTYGGRIPGARSPASTRTHPMTIKVEKGVMKGAINLTVCKISPGPIKDGKDDADRDSIVVEFEAKPTSTNANELAFKGRFALKGGKGRYASLTGQGVISGYMFCYDPKGCGANQGRYRDMQFVLEGQYSDPTFKP